MRLPSLRMLLVILGVPVAIYAGGMIIWSVEFLSLGGGEVRSDGIIRPMVPVLGFLVIMHITGLHLERAGVARQLEMASKRVCKVAVVGPIFLVMLTVSWALPSSAKHAWGNNELWTADTIGFGLAEKCDCQVWRYRKTASTSPRRGAP